MAYSNTEKRDMLKMYYKHDCNNRAAIIAYRREYPDREVPSGTYLRKLDNNLINYGSFNRKKGSRTRAPEFDNDLDNNIINYVVDNPQESTRSVARSFPVSHNYVHKLLKKHNFKAFKIKPTQTLHNDDPARRLVYCNWLVNNYVNVRSILWTDESNVSNCGIYNRKNSHYWSIDNPRLTTEVRAQVRFSINVWCGILGDRIIGPYFYSGTLNGQRYFSFVQNDMLSLLEPIPDDERRSIIFQQDGAPAHNTNVVMNFLRNNYNGLIANNSATPWPARSPDLTPCDFFLWGFVKDHVYAERVHSLEELQNRVRRAIALITPQMLRKVHLETVNRARHCIAQGGRHFEHML